MKNNKSDHNYSQDFPIFSPDSHAFNIGVATVTKSVNAAIIFNHLFFWLKSNKGRGQHQIQGRTWMYEKISDIGLHFSYLSEQQIKDSLSLLVQHGYILKGNFASNKFDRTNWYSVAQEEWLDSQKMFSKRSADPMHKCPETSSSGSMDPVYNKDTDNNTDIKPDIYTPNPTLSKKKQKEELLPFGTYVVLKEGEYESLCEQLSAEVVDYYIKAIDHWVPNHKPYKDYAAAIRSWHLSDKKKGEAPINIQKTNSTSPPSQTETIEKNKKEVREIYKKVHHTNFYETYDYIEVRGERENSEKIYFKDVRFKERLIHELTKRKLL